MDAHVREPRACATVAPRSDPQAALGAAVRELRLEHKLSQEELAHLADFHPTWISRLESGRRNPSWANVRRLCAALGIELRELVARIDKIERRAAKR